MLDTKLSCSSLSVDHLGIVSVSLSLDLLIVFVENVLGLVHLDHVSIDGWAHVLRFIYLENIFLARSYNCLLWIRTADVIFLVALCAGNP